MTYTDENLPETKDIRGDIYEENRPWGSFRRFTLNTPSTVKIIKVNPNQSLSLQTHSKRAEFWNVIAGEGTIEIDGVKNPATVGAEFFVNKGSSHRITAGDMTLEILEIAIGKFEEEDIVRLEDKYGREGVV